MPTQLTVEDARQSLNAHVAAKGAEIHEKFGPHIGWKELQRILNDRASVRYPCEIVFEAAPLEPGELACPLMKGDCPDEGFTLHVHPLLLTQLDRVPAVVLYQLVVVNYGDFASADDAEAFGAAVMGMTRDDYYALICRYVDELAEACAC
jgi:hypothetical protein